MPLEEVDRYLAELDEPKRSTLESLRRTILAIVPDADQGLSYGVPVFLIAGQRIAGFSAAKHHVSYLPHSGNVLATFNSDDLAGFNASDPIEAVQIHSRCDRHRPAVRDELL